jgi:hypothetical protein
VQLEKQLAEQSLKDKYETQIKDRDDAIERLKDMKARLSTKMLGETLEQHCEIEFNRVRSMALASRNFQTAINEIDKSIDHLQKTKDALIGTDRNLRLANEKAQDVTIKKLTRSNPTMATKFAELKSPPAEAAE